MLNFALYRMSFVFQIIFFLWKLQAPTTSRKTSVADPFHFDMDPDPDPAPDLDPAPDPDPAPNPT